MRMYITPEKLHQFNPYVPDSSIPETLALRTHESKLVNIALLQAKHLIARHCKRVCSTFRLPHQPLWASPGF